MRRKFNADALSVAPGDNAIVETDVAVDAQPEQLRYDPIHVQLEFCAGEGNLPHDAGSRGELAWGHDTGSHVGRQPWLVLSLLTDSRCDCHRFLSRHLCRRVTEVSRVLELFEPVEANTHRIR
jgi:hypothetical protein